MINQINPTNKAILYLLPPYDARSDKIRRDTNISCKQSKLTLIKIIQAKHYYDYGGLVKLIHRVIKHPNKPIIVIIDKDILNTPINTILWSVLGTMQAAKLIKVATYERNFRNIKLCELTGDKARLLELSAYYFKTYFVFNWEKTTGRNKANIDDILIKLKDTPPSFKEIPKNFVVKLKQYFINLKTNQQNKENLKKAEQRIKEKLRFLEKMNDK